MPQQFEQSQSISHNTTSADEEHVLIQGAKAAEHSEALDALDAVLDDIEIALETNAEEYVSSFVQKGGE